MGQDLQKTLLGHSLFLVRVTAPQEVSLFEEVGALRMMPHWLDALAADHHLLHLLLAGRVERCQLRDDRLVVAVDHLEVLENLRADLRVDLELLDL